MKSLLGSLFGRLLPKTRTTPARVPRPRFRPNLENLDARIVPTVFVWDPASGSTDGGDSTNWAGGTGAPLGNGTDEIYVGSGKGDLVLGTGLADRLVLAQGFTNTVTLSVYAGFMANDLACAGGTLKMASGGIHVYDTVNMGFDLTNYGTATLDSSLSSQLVVDNIFAPSYATIQDLVCKGGTSLKFGPSTIADVNKIQFIGGNTVGIENQGVMSLTYVNSGDGYYGAAGTGTDVYWNQLLNSGKVTLGSTAYSMAGYIKNNGIIELVNGQTLIITGRDTATGGGESVSNAGGGSTIKLSGAYLHASYAVTAAAVYVKRGSGTGTVVSTIDATKVTIATGGILNFALNDADLNLNSNADWIFAGNSGIYANLNYDSNTMNKLTCNSIDLSTNYGTYTLTKAGTIPAYGSILGWMAIDTAGTRTGDFANYVGGGGGAQRPTPPHIFSPGIIFAWSNPNNDMTIAWN